MVPSAYDTTREPLHSPTEQETGHDPLMRRFWLLRQALKSGSSMAEALEIAEEVEAFLVVGAVPCPSHDTPNKGVAAQLEIGNGMPRSISQAAPFSLLEPEKKVAISARLEVCNSNAQLAAEFGLTPRQVQGFRMQVGRRAKSKVAINPQERAAPSALAIDEVVRYLRQQGDVVVADGPGMFLVNGRFRVDVGQLQHRANRMRQRQRKPEFQIGERLIAKREGGSAARFPAPTGR